MQLQKAGFGLIAQMAMNFQRRNVRPTALPGAIIAAVAEVKKSRTNDKHRYLETVSRACALLREFGDDGQTLSLAEIRKRTGMERTICFRLLHTLEKEGFLRNAERRKYASNLRILSRKRFRIGYASARHDSFSGAVSQGLRWAARERQLDLIECENNYSPRAALRNAALMVKERVDLAIEFQVFSRVAPKISDLFRQAGIPLIAIHTPHPGAVFFGVDSHKAGQIAGRKLLQVVREEWSGEFDELILQDLEIAGSVPHLRLTTIRETLRKGAPGNWLTTFLDSRGEFFRSFEMTRKHLQSVPMRRTLVAGVNDYSVLGALRAFDELGRSGYCYAIGMNGVPESRHEFRSLDTRLIGTVGFFPENYGNSLLDLALDILQHKGVAPANYTPIQLITPRNIDRFYPKDIYEQKDLAEALS
jgi:ribose transport system substrate-binding protein